MRARSSGVRPQTQTVCVELMARSEQAVSVNKHALRITNMQKVLWPRDGYTKGDLIAYYRSVSKWLLPYVEARPLTLQRWPNGIDRESFFEKDAPRGTPEWVKTITLPSTGKHDTVTYIVCEDEATLVFVANLATITLHVWTSRLEALDHPDFVLFDLDPWEGCTLKTLATVAFEVRAVLEELELAPLIKTSGGTGLHIILRLTPTFDYDAVKAFAEMVARRVADRNADMVTLERMTRKRRRGAVYLDWVQVGKGKTIVPPFAVRGRDGAPVSMPLAWAAVAAMARKNVRDPSREFARWTMVNVPAYLLKHGDPWKGGASKRHSLNTALRKARKAWS